jgi:anti-anti-sigma regulatory factor
MAACLVLPRELTIYSVGELRPTWLDQVAASSADVADVWSVDAAAVEEVDGAGVQLLQSLANLLARDQRRLALEQPSQALQQACESLGLTALLTRPPAPASSGKASRSATKAKTAARKGKVSS